MKSKRGFGTAAAVVTASAAGVCMGDVTGVSQSRLLRSHAIGLSFPPAENQEDLDTAAAPGFGTFEATVRSVADGTMAEGLGEASQVSEIDLAHVTAWGQGHAEADSRVMSSPATGEGLSTFDYVFSTTGTVRIHLVALVHTEDTLTEITVLTYPTLLSQVRLLGAKDVELAVVTADRDVREASLDTVLMVTAGEYRVTGEARAEAVILSAPLPRMYFDADFSITMEIEECVADFDGNGVVASPDFFAFLTAFFGSDIAADVDGDGVVSSQDFFDFLGGFFGGC